MNVVSVFWITGKKKDKCLSRGKGMEVMRKTRRVFAAFAAAAVLSTAYGLPTMAAGWQQDGTGWWWQEDNGTYPAGGWQWIDGNGDGSAECYYFNEAGYCLQDAVTPDGLQVNASGAWVVNGEVQVKAVQGAGAEIGEEALSYERAKELLLAYYNNLQADDGNYVVFDSESSTEGNGYVFLVRYQMSDAEAQERIRRGGFPSANILVGRAVVDRDTGIAQLDGGTAVPLK